MNRIRAASLAMNDPFMTSSGFEVMVDKTNSRLLALRFSLTDLDRPLDEARYLTDIPYRQALWGILDPYQHRSQR